MNQSKSVCEFGLVSESYENMANEVERIQASMDKTSLLKNDQLQSNSSFMEENLDLFDFFLVDEMSSKFLLTDESTDDFDENVVLKYFETTKSQKLHQDNQYEDNARSMVPSSSKYQTSDDSKVENTIESREESDNWSTSRNFCYQTNSFNVSKSVTNSPDISEVHFNVPSLVSRVKYTLSFITESMPAQTEPLKYHSFESQNDKILSDFELNLPRFPVKCPITMCGCVTMPSHFCDHIIFDHPAINFLRFVPKKVINIQLNPKGDKINLMTCQSILLIKNKLT